MKINEVAPNNMSTASILARINKFIDEFMPHLKPGLPRPEIKLVNSKSTALATTSWKYYYRPSSKVTTADENTVISFQKRAAHDDRTLRRIVAHELCHHEVDLTEDRPKVLEVGFHTFSMLRKMSSKYSEHGTLWQAVAARFNSVYGERFVTPTSDTDFIIEETKPFFVFMKNDANGKIQWQQSKKLTLKMLIACCTYKHFFANLEFKLIKSTNHFLSRGVSLNHNSIFSGAPNKNKADELKKIWDESDDILTTLPEYEKIMAQLEQSSEYVAAKKRQAYEN